MATIPVPSRGTRYRWLLREWRPRLALPNRGLRAGRANPIVQSPHRVVQVVHNSVAAYPRDPRPRWDL